MASSPKSPRNRSVFQAGKIPGLDTPGDTAETIWEACYLGDEALLRQLISSGRSVNAENPELEFPLHLAVHGNKPNIVDLLLVHGALVNAIDGKKCTPLHLAARYGHVEIVRSLLDSHADPTVLDGEGLSPYDLAALHDKSSILLEFQRAYECIECPMGCGAYLQRCLVERHGRTDCSGRVRCCPLCGADVHGFDMREHRAYRCLLSTVHCPLECGEEVYRFDLVAHCYQVCVNKDKVRGERQLELTDLPSWQVAEFADWAIPLLLSAIPKYGLPFNKQASLLAEKRRQQLAELAYENRHLHDGWHDDDGRFEYGTEEHAVLMLIDWATAWMHDKQITGKTLAQITIGAVRNLRRVLAIGRSNGWVDEDGKFCLPKWTYEEHTNLSADEKAAYSNQFIELMEQLDLSFNPLKKKMENTDDVLSKPLIDLQHSTFLHPSDPAELEAAYTKARQLAADPPTAASQIADCMQFVFAMLGIGPAARGELCSAWAAALAGPVAKWLDTVGEPVDWMRVPVAVTKPEGTPLRYTDEQIQQYIEQHGHEPPLQLQDHDAEAGAPLMYTSDFIVIGDVDVEDASTLTSLRDSVSKLLRDCNLPLLTDVTVAVPTISGELADASVFPRPADWELQPSWDYMDCIQGGVVVLREREPCTHPWNTGPIILIRVHQILVSCGPMAKLEKRPLPDPLEWEALLSPKPETRAP